MKKRGHIRAGIGGWTFEPWRGVFYPEKLAQAKELAFASRALPSIEINGTYYRSQTPATFAKWAREVPDGFVFSVKGPRFATNRRVLAEAGESIARFFDSGPLMLGDRLGPLLWQFAPTKKFDAGDFEGFLELLPKERDGRKLRHALEVRHSSFSCEEFVALARRFEAAVVFADHPTYPAISDLTGDFVYARLQKGDDDVPTAYPARDIGAWAGRAVTWSEGGLPDDLESARAGAPPKGAHAPRDVFVYFIHGGKIRAPAAAQAFMAELAEPAAHARKASAAGPRKASARQT
jgi:uncharacterized protein YecE (DUF72 family)